MEIVILMGKRWEWWMNVPFYGSFEDKSQDAQTDSADTHTKETER